MQTSLADDTIRLEAIAIKGASFHFCSFTPRPHCSLRQLCRSHVYMQYDVISFYMHHCEEFAAKLAACDLMVGFAGCCSAKVCQLTAIRQKRTQSKVLKQDAGCLSILCVSNCMC